VYWKFEKGGITYEAIVQAKDWESAVNQGQLLQFNGVLGDLPGQPRGIFVTRTGYQQGAKDYAAAHGIILYELAELPRPHITITPLGWVQLIVEFRSFKLPPDSPGQGPVEELAMGLRSAVFQPHYSSFLFQIDSAWFNKNFADGTDATQIELNTLPNPEVIFYDQDLTPKCTLDEVVRQELGIMKDAKLDRKHVEHVFIGETFLGPPQTNDIFVKVNKVAFDLDIQVTVTPARFNLSNFVQFVLREIPSEKTRTFLARKQ